MKKIILLLFAPILLLGATNGRIEGIIRLADARHPAVGANVIVLDTRLGATTNTAGHFEIERIPEGIYDLQVSYVGYKREFIRGVKVEGGSDITLSVTLEPSPFKLEEIVVTGSLNQHLLKDSPVLTEVITSKELRLHGTSNLSDILQSQTGIEIGTTIGQTQTASLHGLKSKHVLVLVDGERISGKVDGSIDLGQIPMNMVERIEVVKGPLSSIYGSDALGGVVNILTKDPQHTQVKASVTGGNLGRQDYEGSVMHLQRNLFGEGNDGKFLINVGWNKFFGVDYVPEDYFMELPEYDRRNLNLKTVLGITADLAVEAKLDLYSDELTWLAGERGIIFLEDKATNNKTSANTHLTYKANEDNTLRLSANHSSTQRRSWESSVPLDGSEKTLIRDNTATEKIFGGRLLWTTLPYRSSVLNIGFEFLKEQLVSGRILGGDKEITNHVLFLEDEWDLRSVTFTAGGRYSINSAFGSFFAPRIGLKIPVTERTTLRASYGRGYREPSIMDLYIDYDNSGVGYVVKGEPNLKPEDSHGINIGMQYGRGDLLWFRMNYYYNNVRNLIDYYTVTQAVPGQVAVLSYRNIDKAVTQGIDFDIDIHPIDNMMIGIGYNYNSAKDHNGFDLPFRTPHSANSKVVLTVPSWWDFSGTLRGRWYGKKPVTDDQVNVNIYLEGQTPSFIYVNSYFVLDLRAALRPFSGVEIFGGVNNLTDRVEYPFGQIKPRMFYGGVTVSFE